MVDGLHQIFHAAELREAGNLEVRTMGDLVSGDIEDKCTNPSARYATY